MEYEVYSNKNYLNWNAKGDERIIQNVNTILNTFKDEVPYDRLMGRNPDNLDKPLEKVKNKIIEETYDLVNTYETRVKVKEVNIVYEIDDNNSKIPVIKVVIEIVH
ncbi:hypothetical protein [Clostridium butyricum]|uniref:hypothetical protein n=1 Tax=Clostridium butyricum TaxID=1492 RepID=UPI0005C1C767|nr:hypothetical protein [Clostridium butyricum]KIU07899.1 hypothetical protein SC08_Contig83orf01830 [Clostridium butyricum]MBA8967726.1 phage baseplate assembly protein W [Clostridium butyricum]MBA8967740.1 phage baseplate assembly protein W [Clostridium butyricum]MBA8971206.1 phage baseplate assembly protein W [Clostridium butyricum]MBC2427529.1 hypothetical protein [Clostridium butyricum]